MRPLYIQRYLITGLLTFIPIWLTWAVFKFIFSLLSQVNLPLVTAVFAALANAFPETIGRLNQGWLVSIFAFVVTIVALYITGWAASHVFGKRLIAIFEGLIQRIPLAHTIYGGTKKLMSLIQKKPAGTQRVVLIDFPSPELKSVGFVTRTFQDANGRELAAVYVPTTPNPTSGFFLMIPRSRVHELDMTVDEALKYIISMGVVSPRPHATIPVGTITPALDRRN